MATIKNCAKQVITIYNDVFSANLDINETVDIGDDILGKNPEFNVKYLSLKESENKVDFGLERNKITRRAYLNWEHKTIFPLVTVLNLMGISEAEIKPDDTSLMDLLIFKTVKLKKFACAYVPFTEIKTKYKFLNQEDKDKFLKTLRIGCILTFPLGILALSAMMICLFAPDFTVKERVFLLLFFGAIAIVGIDDFYYFRKAKKWDIENVV